MRKTICLSLLVTLILGSSASKADFTFHIGPGSATNQGYYPSSYGISRGYSPFYTYMNGHRYSNPAGPYGTVPEIDNNFKRRERRSLYRDRSAYSPYNYYPNKCLNC